MPIPRIRQEVFKKEERRTGLNKLIMSQSEYGLLVPGTVPVLLVYVHCRLCDLTEGVIQSVPSLVS